MGIFGSKKKKKPKVSLTGKDREFGKKVNKLEGYPRGYFATNVIRKSGKQGEKDLAYMGFNKKEIKRAKANAKLNIY